jgi:hypothetical protein
MEATMSAIPAGSSDPPTWTASLAPRTHPGQVTPSARVIKLALICMAIALALALVWGAVQAIETLAPLVAGGPWSPAPRPYDPCGHGVPLPIC